MICQSELDCIKHQISIEKIFSKVNGLNKISEPKFNLGISELIFCNYYAENIIFIGLDVNLDIKNVVRGKELLETITYIKNDGIITSKLFLEINQKRLSDLSLFYKRRFNEHILNIVNFFGSDDCIDYIRKIY